MSDADKEVEKILSMTDAEIIANATDEDWQSVEKLRETIHKLIGHTPPSEANHE